MLTLKVLLDLVSVLRREIANGPAFVGERNIPSMSKEVHAAIESLIAACATDECEPVAKSLVLVIDKLAAQYDSWMDVLLTEPEKTNLLGRPEVLAMIDAVLEWKYAPYFPTESIEFLQKLDTPTAQICKMYGFVKADGSADLQRLEREIAKPGSEYDPKTFVSGVDKLKQAKADEGFANRNWRSRVVRNATAARVTKKPASVIAPEPLDELIEQDVPLHQICKMKQVRPEAVIARAKELGKIITRSPGAMDFAEPDASEQELERDKKIKQLETAMRVNTHAELSTIEDRVLAMAIDGLDHQQIFDALRATGAPLTKRTVSKILDDSKATASA